MLQSKNNNFISAIIEKIEKDIPLLKDKLLPGIADAENVPYAIFAVKDMSIVTIHGNIEEYELEIVVVHRTFKEVEIFKNAVRDSLNRVKINDELACTFKTAEYQTNQETGVLLHAYSITFNIF